MDFMKNWLYVCLLAIACVVVPRSASAQIMPGMPPMNLCAGSPDNIPAGQTLTVTGTTTRSCIEVPGRLQLASGANLTVGTILCDGQGTIESTGTNWRLTIASTPINLANDPEAFGTGLLAVDNCRVHLQ